MRVGVLEGGGGLYLLGGHLGRNATQLPNGAAGAHALARGRIESGPLRCTADVDASSDLDDIPSFERRFWLQRRFWRSRRGPPDDAKTSQIGSAYRRWKNIAQTRPLSANVRSNIKLVKLRAGHR